jgi:hypothetical protein
MSDEELPLEVYWDDIRAARHRRHPEEPPDFGELVTTGDLVIGTSEKRILVIIKPDGTLKYGPEYHPDEAATIFWEAMGQRRLMAEDRMIVIQHMEAILVRLGKADLECERLRQQAAEEKDPQRKAELDQSAQLATHSLEMVAHQAIELGRGLARRPGIPVPAVPEQVPIIEGGFNEPSNTLNPWRPE